MTEQKERAASVSVLATMGIVAVLAVGLMCAWGGWFVRAWAHERDATGAEVGYTVPGTFGDAFAPIVGVLTSLALGAAIASVLMQRRELELQRDEMREAREQWTKQAEALDEANKHAADANHLAREANRLALSAQLLETSRQRDVIQQDAVAHLAKHQRVYKVHDSRDPLLVWLDYASRSDEKRREFPAIINSETMREWARRTSGLNGLWDRLRSSLENDKVELLEPKQKADTDD